ncbi:MAG: hypothetical protein EU529_04400 [Promethearchaeota archaeon]|nr:MAG: hypothetical protein EU529_04400 [Candidatus Lokiarchaeota archaeon]
MTLKERKLTAEEFESILQHKFNCKKYFFEVHKGNRMIASGDLFFDSYTTFQDFVDHFFYEQEATEIVIIIPYVKGEYSHE